MSDSNTASTGSKTPSISDGEITLSETMTISRAMGELYGLSRQSLHISHSAEDLAGCRGLTKEEADKLYDLVFQVSSNLSRMRAITSQLDEMNLVEGYATDDAVQGQGRKVDANEVLGMAFRVIATSKPLIDWLMEQPEQDGLSQDIAAIGAGDALELAHLIQDEAKKLRVLAEVVA